MKSPSYSIKTLIVSGLLFIESYVLLALIYKVALSQDFLFVSLDLSVEIVLVMMLLVYTLSLTIGAWNTWEQYVIIITPIVAAVFITLFIAGSQYILIACLIVIVLMTYEIYKSTYLKNLLIKEEPRIILRFASRGLLLLFSILGGVVGLIDPNVKNDFNFGDRIANLTGTHVEKFMDKQVESQIMEQEFSTFEEDVENLPSSFLLPRGIEIPKDFTIDSVYQNAKPTSQEIKEFIRDKVNTSIEPYKKYVQPLLSVVTFGMIQLYGVAAYLFYSLTVDLLFWTAKKTGFLKVEWLSVKKENLKF